ncbi:MAG: aldo/keto reductase [Clostridiales Family XIII bacterium]|jgi:predicted aldo/keto reductase-like oxidoreductase|nr:aldo/keto reductase [Clostridiales Family XIII bacterium]
MQYRTFEKTGEKISALGFGAMRLPTITDNSPKIDVDAAVKMVRSAIDAGVNYIDTAYVYHAGESEVLLKAALADGYREKVFIADKFPLWELTSVGDLERVFSEQLARLGTDHIDFYLVHNIDEGNSANFYKYSVYDFVKQKQAEGKIKHVGFSTHGETFEFFKNIIDEFPWEFVQIQLNYMDKEYQAGVKGLHYAGEKNIPVIIMEPLKGGKLTDNIPPTIQKLWAEADVKRSPADWAFRWAGNFPEVLTILSGMSTQAQVDENVAIFSDIEAFGLSDSEASLIDRVSFEYNKLIPYSCTACKYCLPCPASLSIPDLISIRNSWSLYAENPKMRADYYFNFESGARASDCVHCKECEAKCPQHLPISDIMTEVQEIFE